MTVLIPIALVISGLILAILGTYLFIQWCHYLDGTRYKLLKYKKKTK